MEYFETECEAAINKVREYGFEMSEYNTDEEDLNVLKDLLMNDKVGAHPPRNNLSGPGNLEFQMKWGVIRAVAGSK